MRHACLAYVVHMGVHGARGVCVCVCVACLLAVRRACVASAWRLPLPWSHARHTRHHSLTFILQHVRSEVNIARGLAHAEWVSQRGGGELTLWSRSSWRSLRARGPLVREASYVRAWNARGVVLAHAGAWHVQGVPVCMAEARVACLARAWPVRSVRARRVSACRTCSCQMGASRGATFCAAVRARDLGENPVLKNDRVASYLHQAPRSQMKHGTR